MSNKMLTFNYTDAKCIVICGDIHGDFEEMVFKLCVQYGMTDTLLIVAGDCGFGFEKAGYYEQIFSKVSRRLTKANNWIAMIRGLIPPRRLATGRMRCLDLTRRHWQKSTLNTRLMLLSPIQLHPFVS